MSKEYVVCAIIFTENDVLSLINYSFMIIHSRLTWFYGIKSSLNKYFANIRTVKLTRLHIAGMYFSADEKKM